MYAFGKLSIVQTKLYTREPMGILFTILLGPMLLVLMSFIFGNAPRPELNGLSQMDISVPSYIALIIGITGLSIIPVTGATRRETGVLRRFSATPLKPLIYFLADILAPFLVTLAGIFLLVLLGSCIYHVHFEGQWLNLAAGVSLSIFSFFTLGYAIAGIVPNVRAAIVLGNAIVIPVNLLSGALIPLEVLPAGVKNIAQFIPLTHVVTLVRGLWFGDIWGAHLLELAVLSGIFLVGIVVVTLTFKWE